MKCAELIRLTPAPRRRRSLARLAIALLLGAVPAVAARADNCAPVIAAQIAQAKVPYRITSTASEPGRPDETRNMILVGGRMYFEIQGQWRSLPFTPEETIARINKVAKEHPAICAKSGAETINGDATSIYTGHNPQQTQIVDSRIWISDHSGLPMKAEVHFAGGRTMVTTFDYGDVTPPPGAK